jgi:hypothetical protein
VPGKRDFYRMPKDQQLVMSSAKLFAEWQPVGQVLLVKGHGIKVPADFQPVDPNCASMSIQGNSTAELVTEIEETLVEHSDMDIEVGKDEACPLEGRMICNCGSHNGHVTQMRLLHPNIPKQGPSFTQSPKATKSRGAFRL